MIALDRLSVAQYMQLTQGVQGMPQFYAPDGLGSIFLYPKPNGHVVSIETRSGATEFSDLDTEYAAPAGYKHAMAVSLAVMLAPTLLGAVPAPLIRAEMRARNAIMKPEPAIVDNAGYQRTGASAASLLLGGGAIAPTNQEFVYDGGTL